MQFLKAWLSGWQPCSGREPTVQLLFVWLLLILVVRSRCVDSSWHKVLEWCPSIQIPRMLLGECCLWQGQHFQRNSEDSPRRLSMVSQSILDPAWGEHKPWGSRPDQAEVPLHLAKLLKSFNLQTEVMEIHLLLFFALFVCKADFCSVRNSAHFSLC